MEKLVGTHGELVCDQEYLQEGMEMSTRPW